MKLLNVICVCGEAEVLVDPCSTSGPKLMVLETYGDDDMHLVCEMS